MSSVTVTGVGSGLDIESIVTSMMKAERLPIDKLTTQKTELQAQFTSYGKLSTALDAFRTVSRQLSDPSAFRNFNAASSNESVATATASSAASSGTFDLEVEQLAKAHKQTSAEKLNTDVIGTTGDSMAIQIAGSSFSVDIGGKTLDGIRDAINSANNNTGVTARTITGVGNNQKLVLTSNKTGTANALNASFKDAGGSAIADPLGLTNITAAQDAKLKVDSYSIVRSSNTITDAIAGVTLNLKAPSTVGDTTQINVTGDQAAAATGVQSFVDAYNKVVDTISTLKYKEGLFGDPLVRQVEDKMRSVLNAPAAGLPFNYLSQVGVSSQIKDVEVKDGVIAKQSYLTLDTTKLNNALSSNFSGVRSLFADNSQGVAKRMAAALQTMLKTDGSVDSRRKGLTAASTRIDTRTAALERRMTSIEAGLRKQFSTMDSLVGSLKSTGAALTQQFSNSSSN